MTEEETVSTREAHRPAASGAAPSDILTVDDAASRHPGHWILMKVTEFDENRLPSKGIVVAHDRSRKKIADRHIREISPRRETGARYYVFEGQPYARTGSGFQETIREAAAAGVTDAGRRW